MKKLIILVGLMFILVACSSKTGKVASMDTFDKKVEEKITQLKNDAVAGGFYIIESDSKSYIYIQDDRRNRSLLAQNIKSVKLDVKKKTAIIKVKRESINQSEAENRDVIYELKTPKDLDDYKLFVNDEETPITEKVKL